MVNFKYLHYRDFASLSKCGDLATICPPLILLINAMFDQQLAEIAQLFTVRNTEQIDKGSLNNIILRATFNNSIKSNMACSRWLSP